MRAADGKLFLGQELKVLLNENYDLHSQKPSQYQLLVKDP